METNLESKNIVNVVLTDDHRIVRHAIKSILDKSEKFKVVAEAENAAQALNLVIEKNPSVLFLDLGLPGKSGIEVIYELREKNSTVKILVLTMYEDELRVQQAIDAGADGYLLKTASPEEILNALEVILAGQTYLPERFEHIKPSTGKKKLAANAVLDPLSKLSKREREVFFLLADGMPNRLIAKKLYISPRTVETHRARVIKKMGFNSTADLIRYAIRNNILSL